MKETNDSVTVPIFVKVPAKSLQFIPSGSSAVAVVEVFISVFDEGGRLGRMLRDATYTGITPEFWGKLDAVAGRDAWRMYGITNCGKGQPGQGAHLSHGAAPAQEYRLRLKQIPPIRRGGRCPPFKSSPLFGALAPPPLCAVLKRQLRFRFGEKDEPRGNFSFQNGNQKIPGEIGEQRQMAQPKR